MNPRKLTWIVACVAFVLGSTAATAGGDFNILYGQKRMDLGPIIDEFESFGGDFEGDPLSDLETLPAYGFMFNWAGGEWPIAIAVDYIRADQDVNFRYEYYDRGSYFYSYKYKVDLETQELDIGIRKAWGGGKVQFYLGGGWAYVKADVTVSGESSYNPPLRGKGSESFSESDDGTAWGIWADAGIVGRIGKHVNLGADFRWSDANLDVFADSSFDGFRVNGGGTQVSLFIGGRW